MIYSSLEKADFFFSKNAHDHKNRDERVNYMHSNTFHSHNNCIRINGEEIKKN